MKQLHKRAYHKVNLEAIKPVWNVSTALLPTNEYTLVCIQI